MIKNIVEGFIIIMGMLLIILTFFSPVIISIITGNWWFMSLFLVSYIPCAGELIIMGFILGMLE